MVAVEVAGVAESCAVIEGVEFDVKTICNSVVADSSSARPEDVAGGLKKEGDAVAALDAIDIRETAWLAEAEGKEGAKTAARKSGI